MKEIICDFIKKRFKQNNNWTDGNCLWFAIILQKRFPFLDIFYLPIVGHFIVGIKDEFFDWTGSVTLKETPILLTNLKTLDPKWYIRLIRDCFM